MASFEIAAVNDEKIQITGHLTRQSISGKQQKYFAQISEKAKQDVDLSGINKIDTAGLAWLIALFEYAEKKQIQLSYSQPPMELVKLAKLNQVETLLPFTEPNFTE